MKTRHIPRGIHSVAEHEPIAVWHDETGSITPEAVERVMTIHRNNELREQVVTAIWDGLKCSDGGAYIREEDAGNWTIDGLFNLPDVAGGILAIPRIRDALKLMDDIDAGVVELITHGSTVFRTESSDAR